MLDDGDGDSMTKAPNSAGADKNSAKASSDASLLDRVLDTQGIVALLNLGVVAGEELRRKNRYMVGLMACLALSLAFNVVLYNKVPEPKLLGETTDGRIRELPLLNAPMYSDAEILAWAEKCITTIYDLSYNDWEKHVQNETGCLSDSARSGFVGSLRQVGVLDYLTREKQGIAYATPQGAVLRKGWIAPQGYWQWVVEVPYRLTIEGKQRGSIELVMMMQIRRVSLTWRESGLWVANYKVTPKGNRP